MRTRSTVLFLVLSLAVACRTVGYAVPGELSAVAPLRVSGRQGLLLHQRLSFGPYATGEVNRSATRGKELSDVLQSHAGDYSQRYAFSLARAGAKVADVACTAEGSAAQTLGVTWQMDRRLQCDVTAPDGERRTLALEATRDRPLAGRVTGSEWFEVTGSNRVAGGPVTGTAGYTIARGDARTPVAAVDVTNDGAVYLAAAGDDALAAVAAALLLYQDPLQASERFRDP
jgi:hypothetical protein